MAIFNMTPAGSFSGLMDQIGLAEEFDVLPDELASGAQELRELKRAGRDWQRSHVLATEADASQRAARRFSVDGSPDFAPASPKPDLSLTGSADSEVGRATDLFPARRPRLTWSEFSKKYAGLISQFGRDTLQHGHPLIKELDDALRRSVFSWPPEKSLDAVTVFVHDLLHDERIPLGFFCEVLLLIYCYDGIYSHIVSEDAIWHYLENRHQAGDAVTEAHLHSLYFPLFLGKVNVEVISSALSWQRIKQISLRRVAPDEPRIKRFDLDAFRIFVSTQTKPALEKLRPERRDFVVALLVEHLLADRKLTPKEKTEAFLCLKEKLGVLKDSALDIKLKTLTRSFLQEISANDAIDDETLYEVGRHLWQGGSYPEDHLIIRDDVVVFDPALPDLRLREDLFLDDHASVAAQTKWLQRQLVPHYNLWTSQRANFTLDRPVKEMPRDTVSDLRNSLLSRTAYWAAQGKIGKLSDVLDSYQGEILARCQDRLIRLRSEIPLLLRPNLGHPGDVHYGECPVNFRLWKIRRFREAGLVVLEDWHNPQLATRALTRDLLFFDGAALEKAWVVTGIRIGSVANLVLTSQELEGIAQESLAQALKELGWDHSL